MATPLRSLFLAVGVKGDAAVANLKKIEVQADLTAGAFLNLANTALMAKNAMGFGSMAGGAKAAKNEMAALRREALLTDYAIKKVNNTSRAGGIGGGGRMGDPRFRGAIGVGTSVFIGTAVMGVGAAAFHQRAGSEREAIIASFAGGRSKGGILSESEARARKFNLTLLDSTILLKEVEQLGLKGMPRQSSAIADSAAQFHILNDEIASEDAAAGIYRLIKATSQSGAEFENNLLAAERYASAIQIAGQNSAAGAGQVFEMAKELQPLARVMKLDAADLISLASAFSDLNADQKELFRGSLTRMALRGIIDPNNPMASLTAMGQKLSGMKDFAQRRDFLASLGMTVRDPITISAISNELIDLADTSKQVRGELEGMGAPKIRGQTDEVLKGLKGRFDALKTSMSIMGAKLIETLTPALVALMEVLTGLADVVGKSKFLQLLLAGAGIAIVGRMASTLFLKTGLIGAGGLFGGGAMGGAGGSTAGGAMNMVGGLLNLLPGRGLFRGLRGLRAGARAGSSAVGLALDEAALISMSGANAVKGGLFRRIGGGILGMFGKGGVGLAERLAARSVLGGFGGRMASAALGGGPIGLAIMALGLLEKPFARLSGWFKELGQKGGIVGAIFKGLAFVFNILSVAGKAVNWVFGKIGDFFGWLLGILKPLGDGIGYVFDKMSGFVDWLGNLFGDDDGGKAGAPPAVMGGNTTVINNVQVGTATGFEQFMASNGASQAAALYYARRTSLGSP